MPRMGVRLLTKGGLVSEMDTLKTFATTSCGRSVQISADGVAGIPIQPGGWSSYPPPLASPFPHLASLPPYFFVFQSLQATVPEVSTR